MRTLEDKILNVDGTLFKEASNYQTMYFVICWAKGSHE